MSTRQSLRLRHCIQPAKINFRESNSYPSSRPQGYDEKIIAKLNQNSFRSLDYCRIDAILLDAFFVKKPDESYIQSSSDTVSSLPASSSHQPVARSVAKVCPHYTNEIGSTMNQEWRDIDGLSTFWFGRIRDLADSWCDRYPNVFKTSDSHIICHLAARYLLLRRTGSLIKFGDVHFPGEPSVGIGLFATQAIPASTEILETCGSMSLDECRTGISVILPSLRQRGFEGQRLILGPLRFVNHDCNPNSQLQAIPNSSAYIITTILAVEADAEITVSYGDGYFDGNCKCETCTGISTRVTRAFRNAAPKSRLHRHSDSSKKITKRSVVLG